MKKQFIALMIFAAFGTIANAQVNPHAIGVRGGLGNFGRGGEVSYQHGLGSANRLELDLGWRGTSGVGGYSHLALTGIYHWVWNIEGGLNWFAGPGARVGLYSDKSNGANDGLTVSVGGQIGIEYDFNELGAPLQLALDTRPMWGFLGGTSGFGYGGAFSLRYTF
ncbi:MAG: hypothetical protein P8P74_02385 [Crocinitomicaceae bacterium]|nr:hypothetical protein [Crocinitomicaceae bacterium]